GARVRVAARHGDVELRDAVRGTGGAIDGTDVDLQHAERTTDGVDVEPGRSERGLQRRQRNPVHLDVDVLRRAAHQMVAHAAADGDGLAAGASDDVDKTAQCR